MNYTLPIVLLALSSRYGIPHTDKFAALLVLFNVAIEK
jgi:hypothetical protein